VFTGTPASVRFEALTASPGPDALVAVTRQRTRDPSSAA
jgi:hypothetical protein